MALEDTDPFLIERAEEELLEEGVSRDDIMLLCDARSQLFIAPRRSTRPSWSGRASIHTLMEEHRRYCCS
jgi:hypothetical protein